MRPVDIAGGRLGASSRRGRGVATQLVDDERPTFRGRRAVYTSRPCVPSSSSVSEGSGCTVVEALHGCGCPVTVVSDDATSSERIDRARAAGARIVRGDFRTPAARREAEVATARAVVLTTANDVDNLEAALEVRGEAPTVRVVMRHSQPRLARRFESDFGITAALAPADIAADAFVAAAMAPPTGDTALLPAAGPTAAVARRPLRTEFVAVPALLLGIYARIRTVNGTSETVSWSVSRDLARAGR